MVSLLFGIMSLFKGFTFEEPKKGENKESEQVSELTFQFSQISAKDEETRLASFQAHRSPLSSRSLSDTQEKRRLKALQLQKQVCKDILNKKRMILIAYSAT